MRNKDIAIWVAIVLGIIAIVVSIKASISSENSQWVCSQVVCDKYMTQEEWVNTFCELNASNEFNCRVNINGQQMMIPLKWLNLSNVRQCKEFRCVQEVLVRPANYTIDQKP